MIAPHNALVKSERAAFQDNFPQLLHNTTQVTNFKIVAYSTLSELLDNRPGSSPWTAPHNNFSEAIEAQQRTTNKGSAL